MVNEEVLEVLQLVLVVTEESLSNFGKFKWSLRRF